MRGPLGVSDLGLAAPVVIHQRSDMAKPKLDDLLKLPVPERIELAMALWDSIAEPELQDQLPLTEAQKAELDRRLAEHDRNPSRGIPWEEVQRRLRDK